MQMKTLPRSLSSLCRSFSEVLSAHCSSRCSLAFAFGRTAELKVNAPWTGPNVHPIPSLSVCLLMRHRTDESCTLPLPMRPEEDGKGWISPLFAEQCGINHLASWTTRQVSFVFQSYAVLFAELHTSPGSLKIVSTGTANGKHICHSWKC